MNAYWRKSLTIDESTAYQFVLATLQPAKVYRLTTLRKQTKNVWAREDASFVVLQLALLAGAAAAWGVAYEVSLREPLSFLWLVLHAWGQYLVGGALVATASWAVANKALRTSALPYSAPVGTDADWAFAWDVHTNGFTTVFWLLYVAELLAAPLVLGESWMCTLTANALWACAITAYWYSAYLGWQTLPLVRRPNAFLAPAGAACVALLFATIFNVNVARLALGFYIE